MSEENKIVRKIIYILGSSTLQHQFLEYVIDKEIHTIVRICEDFRQIYQFRKELHIEDDNPKEMILIDSSDHSFEQILKDVVSETDNLGQGTIIALFNLNPDLGVEKKALSRHVKGFFYKDDSIELFLKGIRALFEGEIWISRKILLKFVLDSFEEKRTIIKKKTELTQREIEILSLVSMGAGNEEIADKMHISPNTVKTHLYNIFKKIKVPNRLQAALWAAKYL
jgi:DNA-binding NarL/FixJ family response regulator